MADEDAVSERSTGAPSTHKARPSANPVLRVTLIVIAICLALFIYGVAADRYTPYTVQGLVQAYLVRIAPEVSGRVSEVNVSTDQRVAPGATLFQIDPEQYEIAVRRAEAYLQTVGQSIGASTAAIATAQAKVAEALAQRENAADQAARTVVLVGKGVLARARQIEAQANLDAAEAIVRQAEAELERATQALGPVGDDNPQIREAMAALAQANLDLQNTTVVAPSEGGATSLALAAGQMLGKGETAMSYLDLREVWIEAAFKENNLENITVGDPAEIVLDILPGRVFSGRVSAIGYAVGNRSVDVRTGLPSPRTQSGWIRSPQLMPVRVEFDVETKPNVLRFGSQANVMIYTSDNSFMNAIAYLRMRLGALLAYVQ